MTSLNMKSIAKLLRQKSGCTVTKYAKNNKVTRQSIYDAMSGKGARRIRVQIAKTVEIPPSLIWGENDRITRMIDDVHYMESGNGL